MPAESRPILAGRGPSYRESIPIQSQTGFTVRLLDSIPRNSSSESLSPVVMDGMMSTFYRRTLEEGSVTLEGTPMGTWHASFVATGRELVGWSLTPIQRR